MSQTVACSPATTNPGGAVIGLSAQNCMGTFTPFHSIFLSLTRIGKIKPGFKHEGIAPTGVRYPDLFHLKCFPA